MEWLQPTAVGDELIRNEKRICYSRTEFCRE